MTILLYLILGIIQGFTEPIPVSSSGHLIIFKHLFQIDTNNLNFEIIANFGSFLAIIYIFKNDLTKLTKNFISYIKTKNETYKEDYKYCILIIIGTIPAIIFGFILNDYIEKYLSNIKYIGISLLITALFLFAIRKLSGSKNNIQITYKDAIKIGLFQTAALLPGISRSGATLVGGMLSNLKREVAFKFSFMLYIPISLATVILGIKDITTNKIEINLLFYYIIGGISSFIVTIFATNWFKNIMLNGKLIYFVYYCVIAGILVILFL